MAVIIGLSEDFNCKKEPSKKFSIFCKYAQKYSGRKIAISKKDFLAKELLFDRGIALAKHLRNTFDLRGKKLTWSGMENNREDSSDIYSDGIGISLKDSSKIIRNCGFDQFIKTFCKNTVKEFKDPFWEFAPRLSASYLKTVLKDCADRGFFSIRTSSIYIGRKKKRYFQGGLDDILNMELDDLIKTITKTDIKELVKDFSKNGNLSKLLNIRRKLVKDVAAKVLAVIKEGLSQGSAHFNNNMKHMLQYRQKRKLFGFSSKSLIHAGEIKSKRQVRIQILKTYVAPSKLTDRTTGLQINFYTTIELNFSSKKETVVIQNQLRYKHRTFSSAPEANLHLLNYSDWKKIYPTK